VAAFLFKNYNNYTTRLVSKKFNEWFDMNYADDYYGHIVGAIGDMTHPQG
jgi:hypothetical protein